MEGMSEQAQASILSQLDEFDPSSPPSPRWYRDNLVMDAPDGDTLFGDCILDFQREDFEALDAAWMNACGVSQERAEVNRGWIERPRGHSKTMDIACMVTYALVHGNRAKLNGVVAAADKEQAGLIRDKIEVLLRLNPDLPIEVNRWQVKNPSTGAFFDIWANDAAGSYGATPDFVVIDEITHWQKKDMWDSLISSAAKRPHCVLVVITNAGFYGTWQWERRENARQSERWHFSRLDGVQVPWITEEVLNAQREDLDSEIAYRRLWQNEWCHVSGEALDAETIDAAIKDDLSELDGPEEGWEYFAGLDLSWRKHHTSLVVVGRKIGSNWAAVEDPSEEAVSAMEMMGSIHKAEENAKKEEIAPLLGELKLAVVRNWIPPKVGKLKLTEVEPAVRDVCLKFGAALFYDPAQAIYMMERLSSVDEADDRGPLTCVDVPPTTTNLQRMGTCVIEGFNDYRVALYSGGDADLLISDLRKAAQAHGPRYWRLVSPDDSEGHGDRLSAFQNALWGAAYGPVRKPSFADLARLM